MAETYARTMAGLRTETRLKFFGQITFNRFKKILGFTGSEKELHHLDIFFPNDYKIEANYFNEPREWLEKKDKDVITVEIFEKGRRFLLFNVTEDGVRFLNFRDINPDKERWISLEKLDHKAIEWGIKLVEWLEKSIKETNIRPLKSGIKNLILSF